MKIIIDVTHRGRGVIRGRHCRKKGGETAGTEHEKKKKENPVNGILVQCLERRRGGNPVWSENPRIVFN